MGVRGGGCQNSRSTGKIRWEDRERDQVRWTVMSEITKAVKWRGIFLPYVAKSMIMMKEFFFLVVFADALYSFNSQYWTVSEKKGRGQEAATADRSTEGLSAAAWVRKKTHIGQWHWSEYGKRKGAFLMRFYLMLKGFIFNNFLSYHSAMHQPVSLCLVKEL